MSGFDMGQQPDHDRSGDQGATSEVGTVTAAHPYIAADLRALAFPIADLQLAPDNARAHSDADIDAVADSLRLHGQQKPVVAKRTYRGIVNAVLAGNGTLQAARRLGLSHLAVTWFDGADDEAKAYAIRDNLTQEQSRWNDEQLRADADAGLDLLALGFDAATLADLLGSDAPVPKFQPADAEHRLDELQPHCRTCTCRKEGDR